jgi:predicted alpha/beta-fold hydrolase
MFNGECTSDLKAVVEHIKAKYPHSPLLVIGYSLGANIMSKYLGESEHTTPVLAAISISNPFNFAIASKLSEKNPSFTIYNRGLAKDLTDYVQRHIEVFKKSEFGKVLDFLHISQSRSIQEFDERCVIKLFGYKTIEEYYTTASCLHTLTQVKVPMLCVNAGDDPFIHPSILPHHMVKENPNLIFALTARGGHIAFLKNFDFWNSSWCDEASLEFLDHVVQARREAASRN